MTHLQDDLLPVNITMTTMLSNESTLGPSEQSTAQTEANPEWDILNVINNFGLPTVCLFGIVGNILNLTILTRRKLRRSLRTVEQAANLCLIALALSDFMFCLFAFPTTFLPSEHYTEKGFILYYGMYSPAIINVFILTSTWLTVTMATERYFAICHPLNQTLLMTMKRTKLIIVIVYMLSVLFNVPVLWRNQVVQRVINNSTVVYTLEIIPLGQDKIADTTYRLVWAILGNFLPLILLVGFNICICRKIHQSYQYRKKFHFDPSSSQDTNVTLTTTLIVIVVMFLILVAPSEIVLHIASMLHSDNYRSIEAIMNFMQSVNFSVNFILYCIISSYFRKTLRHIVCCYWRNQRRDSYRLSTKADMSKVPLQNVNDGL
uniref:FMRFamide receptor-like n=1 Tax=Crassostrea virginica TaxID=6565 RepID=A0A8B8EC09_CRAVI|nr:FMRFamide receptor-like [Crassostrea virginica]XP_022338182.1 FMRFamide receptor-like [Crassostrea virginica]XP_022338183.1 FMRFamide receptor-like [Crassostrea virginica]XP_022338184.1 FMRFamide receptor-like [Crassostrea virginica]XP_022338185.1 FMRFamide receptor-like [Crassostrea virginica]